MGDADELTDFLEHRAGEHLRGVVRYLGGLYDVVYLRDDVQERRLEEEVGQMLDRLRQEASDAERDAFPFGELRVTIRHFEEAIVLNFPTGNGEGVVVGLEPEVVHEVNSFVVECRRRLHE